RSDRTCAANADKGAYRGIENRQLRVEELQLEHDDGEQREQDESRRLPLIGRLARGLIVGDPAGKRCIDTLRVEVGDQLLALLHHRRPFLGCDPAIEIGRRVEAEHRGPAQFVMLRGLHERSDIAWDRRLKLLDTIGPGAIGRFLAWLDLGHHHHGHAVTDGIFDRRLADELHHQHRLDPQRALGDKFLFLRAAPPRPQCFDRSEAIDHHGFELIRRRRWPELDTERAFYGKHRGLPAHMPLRELSLAAWKHPRGEKKCGGFAAHGSAQSPPSTSGTEPDVETTCPSGLASSMTASLVGLTSWYLRTCTV